MNAPMQEMETTPADGERLPEFVALAGIDKQRFADWVELAAVCVRGRALDRSEFADAVKDHAILDSSGFEGDDEYTDEATDLSSDDPVAILVGDVWRTLESRASDIGAAYPFSLEGQAITFVANYDGATEYVSMLLVDLSRDYPAAALGKSNPYRLLFERVAAAAIAGLIGPQVFLFGTSRYEAPDEGGGETTSASDAPDDDPQGSKVESLQLVASIKDLCRFFGLPFRSVDHEVDGNDKDLTLDLVARLGPFGPGPGGQYLLVQCCTSPNWPKLKRGEPSLVMWRDLVSWDGMPVPAIAVPFREDAKALRRGYKTSQVVVLDRVRLSRGLGRYSLPKEVLARVARWNDQQLNRIPRSA